MKPKHQRLVFVAVSVVLLIVAALLITRAFRDNLIFFYSPSELPASVSKDRLIRIGGLVESGSIVKTNEEIRFKVTDGAGSITVRFQGLPPNLFREGQGVVAEGYRKADGTFRATRILAKHDERYMPPEVAEALKRTGRWQGE